MDHERYPYYFSDPANPPKELDLAEALAAVGKGIWSVLARVANPQPKAAR